MVSFHIQDTQGDTKTIEVPGDMNLNLMEVLKASDYPIEATCGGMALCATCYVEVEKGIEQLEEPTIAELDMLDTLPSSHRKSRLACQIRISDKLQNVLFRLKDIAG